MDRLNAALPDATSILIDAALGKFKRVLVRGKEETVIDVDPSMRAIEVILDRCLPPPNVQAAVALAEARIQTAQAELEAGVPLANASVRLAQAENLQENTRQQRLSTITPEMFKTALIEAGQYYIAQLQKVPRELMVERYCKDDVAYQKLIEHIAVEVDDFQNDLLTRIDPEGNIIEAEFTPETEEEDNGDDAGSR